MATLQEDLAAELQKLAIADAERMIEEFDLLTIEEEAEDLTREIARKVRDRVDAYAKLLEDLVQPDSSLAAMNECSYFSEEEMEQVVKLYRKLMVLVREFLLADLEATPAAYGAFVVRAVPAWMSHKPALTAIVTTIRKGWDSSQPLHRERGYFG